MNVINRLIISKYFKIGFILSLLIFNLMSFYFYKTILPLVFTLALVIFALLTSRVQKNIKDTSSNYHPLLYLSFAIIFLFFVISRFSFFVHYPVPNVLADYSTYYQLVDQIDQGVWPKFYYRTPGYPLFLKLIFLFSNKLMAVVIVQNIMTLMTSLFLIYVVYKKYGRLSLFAAITMGGYIAFAFHPAYDTTLGTESTYVNFLILFSAFFILAMNSKKVLNWILCSMTMACIILIRPSGMFLIVIFIFILIYLFINTYPKKTLFAFGIPFISILFSFSLYNYFTIGSFTISTVGEENLSSATFTFMEPDETFSMRTNACINKMNVEIIKQEDREIINNSWNLRKLKKTFDKYYNQKTRYKLKECLRKEQYTYKDFLAQRHLLRKISFSAIQKNPDIYFKYFVSQLWGYFNHINTSTDYHYWLKNRYKKLFIDKKPVSKSNYYKSMYKEYYNARPSPLHNFKVEKEGEKFIVQRIPTSFGKLYSYLNKKYSLLFRDTVWSILFLLVFVFSFFRLVQSRLSHKEAFIFFIMACAPIGQAFIVSLVESSLYRYSYSLDFVYYLSIVFIPTLIKKKAKE